jgi:pseudouridine-5'-phosphate glycosidase/pseudouridine kinase
VKKLGQEYKTGNRTAQYVAINDGEKNLVMAMADMDILTTHSFPDHWRSIVETSKPDWLVVDGNWSGKDIREWVRAGGDNGCKVAFEPVSAAKSRGLFAPQRGLPKLGIYPNTTLSLASPNTYELEAMYEAAKENGYLESMEWFQVVDWFGMRGARERFVYLTNAALTDSGVPVQTVQLLPYIPTIITKLGADGVLLTELLGKEDPRLTDPDSEEYILTRCHSPNSPVGGIYMRLYPAAEKITDVVSVNGVGDTFLGVMISGLAQGGKVEKLVDVAQKGAVHTLRSAEAVSPNLGQIEEELTRVISRKH